METRHDYWRPVVNGILYSIKFQDQLTDELASRTAQEIVRHPLAGLSADDQYTALTTAVNTGEDLTKLEPEAHSEAAFRNFLTRVVEQLDALRPWPEPAYARLNLSRFSDLAEPNAIACIRLSTPKVEQKIEAPFGRLDDLGKRAAVLQLSSGAVVALVARWWPESNTIAVVNQGQQDPGAVLTELIQVTALTPDDVERA